MERRPPRLLPRHQEGLLLSFTAFGTKGVVQRTSYGRLQAARRQKCASSSKPASRPFRREETIEIYAFMEAADASKKAGGKPVMIADILAQAQKKSAEASASAGGK